MTDEQKTERLRLKKWCAEKTSTDHPPTCDCTKCMERAQLSGLLMCAETLEKILSHIEKRDQPVVWNHPFVKRVEQ